MKQIIVAYDRLGGIGAENDLLWKRDLPADLRHFKELTTNTSLVMGRKTFESIGRPLPNRQNIVVSSQQLAIEGIFLAKSLEEAYLLATYETISVIGGEQVYRQAIDSVDEIVATEVNAEFPQAEVFFPTLDKDQWHEVSRDHHESDENNKYSFDFVLYRRT